MRCPNCGSSTQVEEGVGTVCRKGHILSEKSDEGFFLSNPGLHVGKPGFDIIEDTNQISELLQEFDIGA